MWTLISLHQKNCNICVPCLSCGWISTGFVCWFHSLLLSTWLSWIWHPHPPKKSALRNLIPKKAPKPSGSWPMGRPSSARSVGSLTKMWLRRVGSGNMLGPRHTRRNVNWSRKEMWPRHNLRIVSPWNRRNHGLQLLEKSSVKPRAASIPWMRWTCPNFLGFLESNIGIAMPDRTTLEKKYLCIKGLKPFVFPDNSPYLSEFQNHTFFHILAFSAHILPKKMT